MVRRPPRQPGRPAAALAVVGAVTVLQPLPAGALASAVAAAAPSTISLQARVEAVRAALRASPLSLSGGADAPPMQVAQAASWTNWPKWSKWSNWGNK